MDRISNKFSLKKIQKIWVSLTILFVFSGLIVLAYDINKTSFVILSNTINLFLFSLFVIFRGKIEKNIAKLIDESKNLSIKIKCSHENKIGFAMISIFILISSIIIFFALYDIRGYRFLIKEDGIIEYGSAIFWFVSAVIIFFHILILS